MAANQFEINVNINSTVKSEAEMALGDLTTGSLPDVQLQNGDIMSGNEYQDMIVKMESDVLKEGSLKNSGKSVGKALVAASAVELAITGMNWAHSRVSTIYKDQARANKISNRMNTLSAVGGLAGEIAAGYAKGGVVGGTINMALQLATEAIKIAQRVEAYQDKQKDYADESDYAMERLGLLAAGKGR